MSELPPVRLAACGHWIDGRSESNASTVGTWGEKDEITLCPACFPHPAVKASVEFKRQPGRPRKVG